MRVMTFMMSCREFFGTKPGQTLQEFASEIRELTPEDKAYFIELFKTVDIDATKTA